MTKHILGLFQGESGAKAWRRHLSSFAVLPGAGLEVIEEAQTHIQRGAEFKASDTRELKLNNREQTAISVGS